MIVAGIVVATANAGQNMMEEDQEKVEYVEVAKDETPPEPEPAPPPPDQTISQLEGKFTVQQPFGRSIPTV